MNYLKKYWYIGVIVIAAAILAVVVGKIILNQPQPPIVVNPPQATSTPPVIISTTTPEVITSDVDTSGWKTYRNEEYGFEFRYNPAWPAPETLVSNEAGYTMIMFGPWTSWEGTAGRLYKLIIYKGQRRAVYIKTSEQCTTQKDEICVYYDPIVYPYYSGLNSRDKENKQVFIREFQINGFKAYASMLGDMFTWHNIFIEGFNSSYRFDGGVGDKEYYSAVLSFIESTRK
jgi:hypothetical protein